MALVSGAGVVGRPHRGRVRPSWEQEAASARGAATRPLPPEQPKGSRTLGAGRGGYTEGCMPPCGACASVGGQLLPTSQSGQKMALGPARLGFSPPLVPRTLSRGALHAGLAGGLSPWVGRTWSRQGHRVGWNGGWVMRVQGRGLWASCTEAFELLALEWSETPGRGGPGLSLSRAALEPCGLSPGELVPLQTGGTASVSLGSSWAGQASRRLYTPWPEPRGLVVKVAPPPVHVLQGSSGQPGAAPLAQGRGRLMA